MSFRKRDDGDYSVTANIDVDPSSSGGHWFDVGGRVPAKFSALRVSGDAYNNHGEFRGRHSVVITRDYGVWHIDSDERDVWDLADAIVTAVEKARREQRDGTARVVFGLLAGLPILVLGSSAPVDGTQEVVLVAVAAFSIGGFVGGYFARPRDLPRLTIFDATRDQK